MASPSPEAPGRKCLLIRSNQRLLSLLSGVRATCLPGKKASLPPGQIHKGAEGPFGGLIL
jgi:hypothetical protein